MGNLNRTQLRKVATLAPLVLKPARARAVLRCLSVRGSVERDDVHLEAAMRWLCRAQDAVGGGGVSYGFSLVNGWLPPYPETTGYCIPTFLGYARRSGSDEYRHRALRMAEWELGVQLPHGGIPRGPSPAHPDHPDQSSVSFDTGQVIQGWCAMYELSGDDRFLHAAMAAGEHLLRTQHMDGSWRDLAPGRTAPTRFSFNARTSWALLDLSRCSGNHAFRAAAQRNIEWTLGLQAANGWFVSTGFGPDEHPLSHTVAYVIEGLLQCWTLTRDPRLLEAVQRACRPLIDLYRRDSSLPAVIGPDWQPIGRSVCVTGCAQMANVWLLLGAADGSAGTRQAGLALLDRVKTWQLLRQGDPDLEGALPGSIPIYGVYEPLRFPNWGVKFFCDAILTAREVANA
jgi:hypothetical protein